MIKEVRVEIKINNRNIQYYREKGYEILLDKTGSNSIDVKVFDVNKNSDTKITAICEICKNEKIISIKKYWTNYERGNYRFYSCFDCKNHKKELTNQIRYGVKSFSESNLFKEKFRNTCLKKYGVDNPNKCHEIREKIERTNMQKYGLTSPLLKKEIKEKNREWMSSDEFRNKSARTILEKFGKNSYSETNEFKSTIQSKKDEIIDKIKKTNLLKYGTDSFLKTIRFRESIDTFENNRRRIDTCLAKYGFDNVSKVPFIKEKIKKTKIDRGHLLDSVSISKWQSYKRDVRKLTKRNKKILFADWDGHDYYDNEFIKDNLSYKHTNRLFPTIDHKISVFYGFNNNISAEDISTIENLCITKRYLNCKKNKLSEIEFFSKIK